MRRQPTRVEREDIDHPGLRLDVDLCLDALKPLEQIREVLRAKYSVTIPTQTLSSYKLKRWQEEKDRIQVRKENYQAKAALVGELGLDAGAAARLWEALDAMTPEQLLALRKQQLQRRELELEIEKLKAGRERDAKAVAEIVSDEKADPGEIRRRIREIYGLAPDRDGRGLADASVPVPEKVDR